MHKTIRSMLVLLAGSAIIYCGAVQITSKPDYRGPKDFPEYWTAGRLNIQGENPYDPARLLAEQKAIEPERDEALMMWNPPPALAVYMPLALLPYKPAGLLWIGIQLLAVLAACDLLWRQYYGNDKRWLAAVVGFLFVGTWWLVSFGQNSGLILFGLAGFLHFTSKGRPLLAGACAALTALKPHLSLAFGVLLIADAISQRGRWSLLGGTTVIALSLGAAILANPGVNEQYLAAISDPGPNAIPLSDWKIPFPAYWLRMAIAPQQFWLQFAPAALVCAGFFLWRLCCGNAWDWRSSLPLVVALSVLSAPYGWIFDLPVLLVPVIWVASRLLHNRQFSRLAIFLIGQLMVMIVSEASVRALHDYWWVIPSILGLCLLGIPARHKKPTVNNSPSIASRVAEHFHSQLSSQET